MRKLCRGTGMKLERLCEIELDRIAPRAEDLLREAEDQFVLDEWRG